MATLAAPARVANPWHGVVRAMTQTGGASLAGGLLSMLATKIIAVSLGPAHVALLATLQQIRQTAVTAGTLTGQTALVQGAGSSEGRARREFLRTALCLMGVATAVTVAVLVLAPGWVARQSGLPPQQAELVRWLVLAVAPSVVYVFLAAVLNSTGAVGALALVQLAAPAGMAVLAYPVAKSVGAGGTGWFVVLLGASSAFAVAGVARALGRNGLRGWSGEGAWFSGAAARKFAAISGAMFASGLFSSWVLIAVRARILEAQGLATGGEFDSAWAISMSQAGLVLASLQTYYLPALARTPDRAQRAAQIDRVLTVACIGSAVLITLLIAMKPLVLTTLYSGAFAGASRFLRWTLVGDYLKITSWIMSIPLLAAAKMRMFLAADVSAYATFAVVSIALSRWIPAAESASIGFVAMYAVHLAFCAACLWLREEFRPSARITGIWLAGFGMILLASIACWGVA